MHGVDRTRRILASSQTSTVSDFLITRDGVEIKLELMNDYTGYWRRYNVLHLRDFKFNQLKNLVPFLSAYPFPRVNSPYMTSTRILGQDICPLTAHMGESPRMKSAFRMK